jgi:hypothetical protein
MRVLFTTLPAYGAFQPLPRWPGRSRPRPRGGLRRLGRLLPRGGSGRLPLLCPAGVDWSFDDREAVYARVRDALGPQAAAFSPLRDVFAGFLPPRMVPDVLADRPGVAVRRPRPRAAGVRGLRRRRGDWVSRTHLRPALLLLGRRLARRGGARSPGRSWTGCGRRTGCPRTGAWRCSTATSPSPCLPPAFLGPGLTIPPTVRFLRPAPFDRLGARRCPPGSRQLPPRPTVHASLGTIFHRTPGVFEAILAGLRDEPVNLLLAVGRDQDPARLGPQPPHGRDRAVPPARAAPAALRRRRHHGGYGSVMACRGRACRWSSSRWPAATRPATRSAAPPSAWRGL